MVNKGTTPTSREQLKKGYEVYLTHHYLSLDSKIEGTQEVTFVRVDSDHIDNLIKKDETTISKLSDEEKETLKTSLETVIQKNIYCTTRSYGQQAAPFITQPEFMRRMKEMSQSGGGGMFGMGNMPDVQPVNTNRL
jgi:molecular chaperone HtpG